MKTILLRFGNNMGKYIHLEEIKMNADDLFGDFINMSTPRDIEDDIGQYWEWPEDFGKGWLRMIKLRPGLVMGIGKYRLERALVVNFELAHSPITFEFSVSGNVSHTITYESGTEDLWHNKQGHSIITCLPPCQGVLRPPIDTSVNCVSLHVEPRLLNTLLKGQTHIFRTDILNSDTETIKRPYCQMSPITSEMIVAVYQILNCSQQFPFKRMYLESKALELIALSLAQFVTSEGVEQKSAELRPDDIKRIRRAKEIINREYADPPTLFQLAKSVGITHSKLNYGFRKIYDVTVFGYLRKIRLEHARRLLIEQGLSVTDVAYAVGYDSLPSFSTAFSKHFGIRPIKCIKKYQPAYNLSW